MLLGGIYILWATYTLGHIYTVWANNIYFPWTGDWILLDLRAAFGVKISGHFLAAKSERVPKNSFCKYLPRGTLAGCGQILHQILTRVSGKISGHLATRSNY